MKVSIFANTTANSETFGFIEPLLKIKSIDRIFAFGDGKLTDNPFVTYIETPLKKPVIFKLVIRLLQGIKYSRKSSIIIGIYEVPHGFLAYLVGLILQKKTILCIIGNPAYKEIRKGFRKWIMYFMIKRMNSTTVTGSNSKAFLINEGFDKRKLHVLPNSIDIAVFKKMETKKVYDIISLGRLSPEKEIKNLINIIVLVKKVFPEIKVGIAGNGPDRAELEAYSVSQNVDENIKFLGYIDNKIEFYNSGKVFLLTSSTEGLPRTLIESMACGTPCIASNVGDISDIIKNSVNGFLIDQFTNLIDFTERLINLLSDSLIMNSFSEKSITFIEENYSHKAASVFWSKLINEI